MTVRKQKVYFAPVVCLNNMATCLAVPGRTRVHVSGFNAPARRTEYRAFF